MEPHSRRAFCHKQCDPDFRVLVFDSAWRRFAPRVHMLVSRAIRATAVAAPGGINVVLASDRFVRGLNVRHRGRNKPTNVLTFERPAAEMVLALGVVRREAAAAGMRGAHHLVHLVVHGALHLSGYDHDHPGDARRMEMAESRLLHHLGVPNPWKRAPGRDL